MHIMAIALGGCFTKEPAYGLTEDTGGHITYILGAMHALVRRADVASGEIVTRRFDDLGAIYAQPRETLGPKLSITRIDSGNMAYLSKEALACDRAAFTAALMADLRSRETLPDLIHAHFADAAEVAEAIRQEFGIPFIYTAHSLGLDKAEAMEGGCAAMAARISLERRAMRTANAIIGSSRDECERQIPAYEAAAPGTIQRVRPGIEQAPATQTEIARAKALIAPFLRDVNKPVILAIARPVRKKNLAALVEAFGQDAALRAKANLVLLPGLRASIETGEPEQVAVMQELTDLIDRHDLYGLVAYPRGHTQGQVRGLYALARQTRGVFVNPALTEPFGLTILEAAAHGVPVVATCNGGPVDIIEDLGHGTLVDPRDPAAIAAAVSGILGDPAIWQSFSNTALQRIAAMNWDDYARQFTVIAKTVLAGGKAAENRAPHSHLLICDIDNTLTGCRKSADQFARMIAENPSLAFGVATGRSLTEAQRLVREWSLPEPAVYITSVGSEIYWNDGKTMIHDNAFSEIIASDWQAARVDDCMGKLRAITPQAATEQRAFKRSYFASPAQARDAERALAKSGCRARVIFSHDRLLDILPRSAGKGAAVQHVADAMGIAAARVIVAGDSGNDIDMIKSAANAIIVANAEPAVRALATAANIHLSSQPYAAGVIEGLQYRAGGWTSQGRRPSIGQAA